MRQWNVKLIILINLVFFVRKLRILGLKYEIPAKDNNR